MEGRRRGSETVRLEEEGGNRCLWGLLLPPPISSPTPIHVKTGGQNEMKSGTCWSGKKAKVGGREALSVGCSPELTSPFFPPFAVAYSRPRRRAGALERRKGKRFFFHSHIFVGLISPKRQGKRFKFDFGRQKRKAIKRHPADRVPHFFRIRRSCLDLNFFALPRLTAPIWEIETRVTNRRHVCLRVLLKEIARYGGKERRRKELLNLQGKKGPLKFFFGFVGCREVGVL